MRGSQPPYVLFSTAEEAGIAQDGAMLKDISRTRVVSAWFALVLFVLLVASVIGGAPTGAAWELWLIACVVPPAAILLLWPADDTMSVAQVLYGPKTTSKNGR
jgi:hypothetical protein